MDPVTQGLLGAALPQAFARREEARVAAIAGFGAGMLADVDVLIRSASDPLLSLEYHRHFTHALAFIPVGGLVAAIALWPFLKRRIGFARLLAFAVVGYATHAVLDACTSYGTRLLLPFSGDRIAWDLVAVVDPAFTIPLGAFVAFAFRRRSPRLARVGLAVALAYLLLGLAQRERAEAAVAALAAERGHRVDRLTVKPTLFNLLVWRSIYESDGTFYVDAVRAGFGTPTTYAGASAPRFEVGQVAGLDLDSQLARDIVRFTEFSDDWVALHPAHPDVVGDLRYAMLPSEVAPLWGIRLDLSRQAAHAELEHFREGTPGSRRGFAAMLRGRPVEE